PPFLFQIRNDVHPRRRGSLVAPKFPDLLNAGKMMSQLAVAHPVRRLARKLVQPAMNFFKRFAQRRCRLRTVFCEGRHTPFFTDKPPNWRLWHISAIAGPWRPVQLPRAERRWRGECRPKSARI